MTQVKCRSIGGKGLTQAAWKYAQRYQLSVENFRRSREKAAEAEKSKITLPTLKWMDKDG